MATEIPTRVTIDLSEYPDLVMISLGMRVNKFRGILTLLKFGFKIKKTAASHPPGLLKHNFCIWELFPPHVGIRQYWRSFEDLENFARSEPHKCWWKEFLINPHGTGFWHETYSLDHGIEAVYVNMKNPPGMGSFAKTMPARAGMFGARQRLGIGGESKNPTPVSEDELYKKN